MTGMPGDRHYRRHPFPHESVFFLQSAGQKRHGVGGGFSGGTFKRDQCAGSGIVPEMSEQVRKNLETLEETWNNYQVYLNDEIDFIDDEPMLDYSLRRRRKNDGRTDRQKRIEMSKVIVIGGGAAGMIAAIAAAQKGHKR